MLESFNSGKFTYQRLTEAEQQKRGILGRLVGVIADTENPTRNNRLYSRKLWEKVFNDPLMQEKIANRCCFGELNHPTDREEIDATKVAICLAEQPKLGNDGKLYGVFDILDLPNGRILKTLCDYGCNIGISSRGSGDVMDNDEVDPDTYYCECFDAVVIPAVKTARLSYMTESLETPKKSLRAALLESYNKADDNDKKVMKESLSDLDIDVDNIKDLADVDEKDIDAVEQAGKELSEEDLDTEVDETEVIEFDPDEVLEKEAEEDVLVEAKDDEEDIEVESEDESDNEETEDEESEEKLELDEPEEKSEEDEDSEEDVEVETIKDLIDELKELDKKAEIEFSPIIIDGVEYPVENFSFDDSEDGKVIVNINYSQETGNDTEEVEEPTEEAEVAETDETEATDEEVAEEPEDDTEEAEDNGAEEVIESLKEIIRQKDLLESELKSLKSERTVSDTEVKELKEELDKYKSAFARTSEVAAKAKKLQTEVSQLNEQLNRKDSEINDLKTENSKKLNEGVAKNAKQIAQLKEELKAKDNALYEAEEKLHEQVNTYKKKVNERTEVAKKYKALSENATNKYISFRAEMLGIKPSDITNKLNEHYTLNDVDEICNKIMNEDFAPNRLPFGNKANNRNPETIKKTSAYDGLDEDLLILAGLK